MAKKKSKPKAKSKAIQVAEEDDVPKPKLRRVREDDESELTEPKTRNDIFTGLAALSLLALIGAAVFFYQDHEETTLKSLAAPVITIPTAAVVTDVAAPKGKTN